jgi:hypothetical protein
VKQTVDPSTSTATSTLTLANGTPVRIVISRAGEQPHPEARPIGELPTFILQIATDVADAAAIGQAILDLLHAGDYVARQARERADALDATIREVEAVRAAKGSEQ